jgi:tellurite resistance protein TerC
MVAVKFLKFTQFQSDYWIEKALSIDNLFVFILIFSYFKIDRVLQQKVLLLGVFGAFNFRAIFIFVSFNLIKLS